MNLGFGIVVVLLVLIGILLSRILRNVLAAALLTLFVALLGISLLTYLAVDDMSTYYHGPTLILEGTEGNYTEGLTLPQLSIREPRPDLEKSEVLDDLEAVQNASFEELTSQGYSRIFLISREAGDETLKDYLLRRDKEEKHILLRLRKEGTLVAYPTTWLYRAIDILPEAILTRTIFREGSA